MNWLITGGCGFLGTSLIKQLLEDGGHRIRVIDNMSVGTRDDLLRCGPFSEISADALPMEYSDLQLLEGDILDEQLALSITKNADVIVHLAANTGVGPSVEDPRSDCMANVIGTFNYLEGARNNNVSRFIFASSGAPAGEVEPPIHEELPPHPVSPYGASKLAGEGYCSAYFRTYGVNTVALRFGNVYGPGSVHKSSVVAKFINLACEGEQLEIYGDGDQTRDFIFIDDLVNAIKLSVVTENVGGEVFQIATNNETTISEMTEQLVKILDKNGIANIHVVNGEVRVGDVKRNYSDTSKAKKYLGWDCKTRLEDGLVITVEYFLNL